MNTSNANTDSSQGEGDVPPPPLPNGGPGPTEQLASRAGNTVFKSGPLFISSKGIGWTSWKKRWFILTRTSLVFFRSDPNAIPQKGSEVNLTLGGIDLNNSGSVVIKADKKLLTVLFPGGREGRAFTLKAETMEDLNEWKDALELALSQAPNASLTTGQNGIFKNDQADVLDNSLEQSKDNMAKDTTTKETTAKDTQPMQPTQPMESLVIGRPVLLALEEVDGSPSFLEKALKFIEEHGVKVEGILRQAADVEDVERRIREYEQGKTEFSAEEDPHVIADCVKYVLREIPSCPVPAPCCNALLEACKKDRGNRVTAMRAALRETLPEPNRWLLRRILTMMQIVASHKAENRMSPSAVAACMAPLLLRPLLAGDLELESDFDVGGDGSIQLLQAAAAANHAQAIVITLLEQADTLLEEEGLSSPEIYSDSEGSESGSGSGSGSEEGSYDGESYESDDQDNASHDSYSTTGDDGEHAYSGSSSRNGHTGGDSDDDKGSQGSEDSESYISDEDNEICSSTSPKTFLPQHETVQGNDDGQDLTSVDCANASHIPMKNPPAETNSEHKIAHQMENPSLETSSENRTAYRMEILPVEKSLENKNINQRESPHVETSSEHKIDYPIQNRPVETSSENKMAHWMENPYVETSSEHKIADHSAPSHIKKSTTMPTKAVSNVKRPTVWGRTPAQKNLSMESIDCTFEEEAEIQKLEDAKSELQSRIEEEVDGNAILQTILDKQTEAFHSRKLALEQDVARLQQQLQRERELRTSTEAGVEKIKAGLEEIALAESQINDLKKRVNDLGLQLKQQGEQNCSSHPPQQNKDLQKKMSDKQKETESMSAKHLSTRKSTRSKDNHVDRADHGNVPVQETKTLRNTNLPLHEKLDPVRNSNSKSARSLDVQSCAEVASVNPSEVAPVKLAEVVRVKPAEAAPVNPVEVALVKPAEVAPVKPAEVAAVKPAGLSTTKKASTREGTRSNRLNFFKGRQAEIANELQKFYKARASGKHVNDKQKDNAPETQKKLTNPEKNVESESAKQLNNNINKEEPTIKSSGSSKKQDVQLPLRVLEGDSGQNHDKVRSEEDGKIISR